MFKYCFRDSFPELQGGTRELSKIFFEKIQVKQITEERNEEYKSIVDAIQKRQSIDAALLIDKMIYMDYGLNDAEIQTIGFVEIV